MTVEELIKELSKLNKKAKVFFEDFGDVTVVSKKINGKNFVFLIDEYKDIEE